MANELVHGTQGTVLTQAEFEATGLHVCNSQATGDLIYASSATQLTRLAIGSTNTVLVVSGGVPTWSATLAGLTLTAPAINGTVTTTGLTLPAITLGGTVTLNSQVFDAGAVSAQINSTGGEHGLVIQITRDDYAGVWFTTKHISASPAANDILFRHYVIGKDSAGNNTNYLYFDVLITSPTDTSEESRAEWTLAAAGTTNLAMTLSGAGELGVDASGDSGTYANVELFDSFDDALVLRQGIQQRNREFLADIGVFKRKDSGSGYMMLIQPMMRLLAGGIYQTRARIDDLVAVIADEFPQVANRLVERGLLANK